MPRAARGRGVAGDQKIWRDAIRRAVLRQEKGEDAQALEKLADKLIEQGMTGDVSAMKEIGDRLDGKAVQQTEGTLDLNVGIDAELLSIIRARSRAAR